MQPTIKAERLNKGEYPFPSFEKFPKDNKCFICFFLQSRHWIRWVSGNKQCYFTKFNLIIINRFYLDVCLELNCLDDVLFWYLFILLAYV